MPNNIIANVACNTLHPHTLLFVDICVHIHIHTHIHTHKVIPQHSMHTIIVVCTSYVNVWLHLGHSKLIACLLRLTGPILDN